MGKKDEASVQSAALPARSPQVTDLLRSIQVNIGKLCRFREWPELWDMLRGHDDLEHIASFVGWRIEIAVSGAPRLRAIGDAFERLAAANQILETEVARVERAALCQARAMLDDRRDPAERTEAARDLGYTLCDDCALKHLENVFASRTLSPPEAAALETVGDLTDGHRISQQFVQWLRTRQPAIASACAAFEALPIQLFGGDELDRDEWRAVLTRRGVFRALAVVPDDHTDMASVAAQLLTRPDIEGDRDCSAIVRALINELKKAEAASRGHLSPCRPDSDLYSFVAGEINAYNRSWDEDADMVPASLARANLYEIGGLLTWAVSDYDELLTANPANWEARMRRAHVLGMCERFDDALRDYQHVLAERPGDAVARTGRARILSLQGRLDEALQAYDEIIASAPDDADAANGRARVLHALGRRDDALAAYEAVRTKHPDNMTARIRCAMLLAALGHYREALDALPATRYDDWDSRYARGLIFLRAGSLDAAEAVFNLGVEHAFPTERDRFRTGAAVVLLRRREPQAIPALLERVESRALQPIACVLEGHARQLSGDAAGALHVLSAIPSQGATPLLEIRDELRRRMGREPARYSDDELAKRELDLVDAATTQVA